MKEWLRKLLSGPDNVTPDIARVLALLGVVTYLGLSTWHAIKDHTFDPEAYGIGLGTVLTAAGAFIGIKGHTEPKGNE